VATCGWISFLSASIATMLFFAVFDPVDLAALILPGKVISMTEGFAAGFFFFWFVCAISSAITAFLVRTAPRRNQ